MSLKSFFQTWGSMLKSESMLNQSNPCRLQGMTNTWYWIGIRLIFRFSMIDSDLQHNSSVWYRYPIGHLSISQDSQHQVLISQHFHENQFQQLQTFFNIVFIFFNNYWELTHDSKLVNPFLRRLHSKYSKISEKKYIL